MPIPDGADAKVMLDVIRRNYRTYHDCKMVVKGWGMFYDEIRLKTGER